MNKQAGTPKKLMTHIVVGYPSIETNRKMISAMADAGVDLIELQIPFSDPIADGKTIHSASQQSLENNITVSDCFAFAREMAALYQKIEFLFMTYYNILFNYGVDSFVSRSKKIGLTGLIVPDIPPEEDNGTYYKACAQHGINPIYVISPTTGTERLKNIKKFTSGFVYCTSRVGTTGAGKKPHQKLKGYIKKAQSILGLPIAIGFGIDGPASAQQIAEFADIIVIGSKVINIVNNSKNNFKKEIYKFLKDVKDVLE